jgi:hypothetical protein
LEGVQLQEVLVLEVVRGAVVLLTEWQHQL